MWWIRHLFSPTHVFFMIRWKILHVIIEQNNNWILLRKRTIYKLLGLFNVLIFVLMMNCGRRVNREIVPELVVNPEHNLTLFCVICNSSLTLRRRRIRLTDSPPFPPNLPPLRLRCSLHRVWTDYFRHRSESNFDNAPIYSNLVVFFSEEIEYGNTLRESWENKQIRFSNST